MILFKKAEDLRKYLDQQRKTGKLIGFVPTMGALHQGHLALLSSVKNAGRLSVCSIFVNPTQFNDPADFKKYPVTIEADIQQLISISCDILFLPPVEEIYPDGLTLKHHYDLGYLETVLEGAFRPGHFQGVSVVVHRLLDIVRPDELYLGQKDYQQCMVIAKMIDLTGLDSMVRLRISPTVREADGLAMSSRNTRLSPEQRKLAPGIYQALSYIRNKLVQGSLKQLKEEAVSQLTSTGFRVDYVEIADADSLQVLDYWNGRQRLVLLAAAFLGEVRLIDNILVE